METVMRYEAYGRYPDDQRKQRSDRDAFAEGEALVMRLTLEKAGIAVTSTDPYFIKGQYQAHLSLGHLGPHRADAVPPSQGPRFDGYDCIRMPGASFDAPRADGQPGRPSPEDEDEDEETKTCKARDAMITRSQSAWRKNKRDRSGVDVPIASNRGNQGDLGGSLGAVSMDGDDAFAGGNDARDAMVARNQNAWMRAR